MRLQKATDARIKGLRDEAKAAGGTAKVYKEWSTALQGTSDGAVRNREAMRRQMGLIYQKAQEAHDQAIRNGATEEEASRVQFQTLVSLRDQLIDNATEAGYSRDAVMDFLDEIGAADKDFKITFNMILDTTTADKDWEDWKREHNFSPPKRAPNEGEKRAEETRRRRANAGNRAMGGEIYGPGGPKEDKVPIWASPGEFIVNAAQYAANRDLVRAINAGHGSVSTGMSIGTVNVTEASGPAVRVSVIDALAEAAYRHGGVR